jgi:hypothetical protein
VDANQDIISLLPSPTEGQEQWPVFHLLNCPREIRDMILYRAILDDLEVSMPQPWQTIEAAAKASGCVVDNEPTEWDMRR